MVMKFHPWDYIDYVFYNRDTVLKVENGVKLFEFIAGCSHLTDTDEVYHMCEPEVKDEEYVYEFIQCYQCITRHFIKSHRKFLRKTIFAEKILDLMESIIGNS